MLNLHKFNNYAFFCPVSRMHLTVSSPVGFADEVTPAILKGLKSKAILDVDGVIDLETGTVNKVQAKAQPTSEPTKAEPEEKAETPGKEAVAEIPKESEKQDKKATPKRGKRAESNLIDEAAK